MSLFRNTVSGVFMTLAILVCCPAFSDDAPALKKVRMQLKWTHQFQFAGYYMAQEKGYYRDAGLDVEFLEGNASVNVRDQVLSGNAEFGVGTSELLMDYAQGFPVVVLGVIYQHSPFVLIMKTEEASNTIESLIGKKVMMEAHSADIAAMLRRQGLTLDQLNVCERSPGGAELLNDVPAISAYLTDEPYGLNLHKIPHVIFTPRAYGIDFYGDNFFTTKSLLEEDPELIEAFRQATIKGWQDALENPDRVVAYIQATYPGRKSPEHMTFEARVTQELMTKLVEPGFMLEGRWQHIAETYIEVGMLDSVPDLRAFIYQASSSLLPAWFEAAASTIGVLFVLLLVVLFYFRYRNVSLQRELLEQRAIELKTKNDEHQKRLRLQHLLLRDIHDGLGGLTSNLSVMSVIASNETHIEKKNEWLHKIERTASETNEEIRDLMNTLSSSYITWGDMISSIRRTSGILFDPSSTTVEFVLGQIPSNEQIGLAEGMSVIRMVRECFNNIVKHAKAGSVVIEVNVAPDHATVVIRDDGCGFDQEQVQRGRGLENLSRRSAELGGTITTCAENGVEQSIQIPLPIQIVKEIEGN